MPRCKYDVNIKDFYFYDEQGTRLKILPEFLSSIFDGGVSEDEKNELVKMAIKQVEEISKNNIVCTLFKQPLSNKSVLCGIFSENGEILDLFENN